MEQGVSRNLRILFLSFAVVLSSGPLASAQLPPDATAAVQATCSTSVTFRGAALSVASVVHSVRMEGLATINVDVDDGVPDQLNALGVPSPVVGQASLRWTNPAGVPTSSSVPSGGRTWSDIAYSGPEPPIWQFEIRVRHVQQKLAFMTYEITITGSSSQACSTTQTTGCAVDPVADARVLCADITVDPVVVVCHWQVETSKTCSNRLTDASLRPGKPSITSAADQAPLAPGGPVSIGWSQPLVPTAPVLPAQVLYDVTHYRVYRGGIQSDGTVVPERLLITRPASEGLGLSDASATWAGTYRYFVSAINRFGEGPLSDVSQVSV